MMPPAVSTAVSPLRHLARLGLLHPYDLVAVQQAQWVECLLHLFRGKGMSACREGYQRTVQM